MHVFWERGELTAAEARDRLADAGRDLSYPTVANLVRDLEEQGFLSQLNPDRPYRYRPARSHDEVSGRLLGELIERVFRGSRERLLVRLVGGRRLSRQERELLEQVLKGARHD
jgi:predicted transcriptional regulator